MIEILTGQTVYDQILSVDADNRPVTAATFNIAVYINGTIDSFVVPNIVLTDPSTGIYTLSWSADTNGDYQVYVANNNTSILFVSETYFIRPPALPQNIYIGL
jgi:hypothetical protein